MNEIGTQIERIWLQLVTVLSKMATEISATNELLRWNSGCSVNQVFPFRGYFVFSRNPDGCFEDVVFSFDCKITDGRLECSSDFASGDGIIIANGPTNLMDSELSEADLRNCFVANEEFLARSKDIIGAQLK